MSKLYLPEHKILFQHVPRTGGSWVKEVFEANSIKVDEKPGWTPWGNCRTSRAHAYLGHYVKANADIPHIEWIFATVRHPVDYYEATWRFLNFADQRGMLSRYLRAWNPFFHAARLFWPDPNEWVMKLIKDQGNWITRLYEGFCGPHGGEFVDYICRKENLAGDLLEFCSLVGIELENLPREGTYNVGSKIFLTREVSEAILETEKIAMDRFYRVPWQKKVGKLNPEYHINRREW